MGMWEIVHRQICEEIFNVSPDDGYTCTSTARKDFDARSLAEMHETIRALGPRPPRIERIIYDENIVEEERVKRTWRERLFSWPCKPWVEYKTVNKPVMYLVDWPEPGALLRDTLYPWRVRMGIQDMKCDKVLLAHPTFKDEIEAQGLSTT